MICIPAAAASELFDYSDVPLAPESDFTVTEYTDNGQSGVLLLYYRGAASRIRVPDTIGGKPFEVDKTKLTIAQVTSVSGKELSKVKERMLPYMEELLPTSSRDMLFLMLTDIFDESTELLFVGQGARGVVQTAFELECTDNSVVLPGVVSRKKQVVVPIIETIEML